MTVPPSRSAADRWLLRLPARRNALMRLYCFPFAGGGVSTFSRWHSLLPDHVEVVAVQMPGRELRIGETPATSMPELVEAISRSVSTLEPELPFLFFGHCAGAMLAYECAVALQDKGLSLPLALFASSAPAPGSWDGERMTYVLNGLDPLDVYKQLGGMPSDFGDDPELADLVRDVLRADTQLYRGYSGTRRPLPLPIVAFTALSDGLVAPELTHQWEQHTANPLRTHEYAGHHFSILDRPEVLLSLVARELDAPIPQPAGSVESVLSAQAAEAV